LFREIIPDFDKLMPRTGFGIEFEQPVEPGPILVRYVQADTAARRTKRVRVGEVVHRCVRAVDVRRRRRWWRRRRWRRWRWRRRRRRRCFSFQVKVGDLEHRSVCAEDGSEGC
jgi:hypothetical protein